MFKALDAATGREVISLDEDPFVLRSIEQSNGLICQECRHRVFPRSGEQRRPHFAHYSLEDCPVRSESPELLQARASLYNWLKSAYAAADTAAHVTLEKKVESQMDFPRPIDCYVRTGEGREVGYWILEGGIRPERRDHLVNAFQKSGILVHWIFLHLPKLVNEDAADRSSILLNTTERELMRLRPHCPQIVRLSGVATNFLQYLNADDKTFHTWRNLFCQHPPQQYNGQSSMNELIDLDLLAPTGHILHPGEREAARVRLREMKEKRVQPMKTEIAVNLPTNEAAIEKRLVSYRKPEPEVDDGPNLITAELICWVCGQRQKPGAWTQAKLGEGTCLCYKCGRR